MRIVTDSAADFTTDELKAYNVISVPLQVVFGQDCYEDGVTLTSQIFWERLIGGENPKTSQPTPDAFLTVFEEAKTANESVVCILLSSGLSGTVQSATIAAAMCGSDDIHIVDSQQAAGAEKMLVLRACQLRDEGKLSAAEIAEELRAFSPRIRLYACLNTLDYLARGGRIPAAAAALGSLVQLKPLITLTDGKVAMIGKGMGLHRATAALIKLIQEHEIDDILPAMQLYTHSPENANALAKKLSLAGIAVSEEHTAAVGSTIGTHIGPGAFGLVFVEKNRNSP